MPHSKPDCTSRTSSLKRFSDVIVPFQITTPSRRNRTRDPRGDRAREHVATGDLADPGHGEDLAHLGVAGDGLLELRLQHADERVLHVLEHLVNDLVEAQLHLLGLGQLTRLAIGSDVEADDRRVRHGREVDVGLGDPPDRAVHERQPHLFVLLVELAQRVRDGFERPLHIGFEHEVERRDLAPLDHREDVLEPSATRERHRVREVCLAAPPRPGLGHGAGDLVVGGDPELVTRERDVVEAEDLDRHRRTRFGDGQAVIVEHRADAAPTAAGDDRLADPQRAALDERGDDRPAARVEVRLEHERACRRLRVGGQLLDVGDEEDGVEELVDTEVCGSRHLVHDRVAAPLLGNELVLDQLLTHAVGVGVFAVDLGDRDDDRHLGRGVRG